MTKIDLKTSKSVRLKTGGKYCAEDIQVVPNLETVNVTPTTAEQEISTASGFSGIGKVNVGAIQTESATVKSSLAEQIVRPSVNNKFINEVIVKPIVLETAEIQPKTTEQVITPSGSANGLSSVKIGAIQTEQATFKTNGTHTPSAGKFFDKVVVDVVDSPAILQEKTVTPTKQTQSVLPDTNFEGMSKVTVNPIPAEFIVPSGSIDITENKTYNVRELESVNVNIEGKEDLTTELDDLDSSLDDLETFVDSMEETKPTTLITKEITENRTYNASDDNADGYSSVNVNVPIPNGYIKPEGNMEITENNVYDITTKKTVTVNVPIPEGYVKPEGHLEIKENVENYDVTNIKTITVDVEGSGGGSTPHPELPYSKYINPTWWDIKTILDEDTENYSTKLIMLLPNDEPTTNFVMETGVVAYKTSDGKRYTKATAHTWDTSQDKQCVEDGINVYKTRYVIFYSNSSLLLNSFSGANLRSKMLYFEYTGSVTMTAIHWFYSLKILPSLDGFTANTLTTDDGSSPVAHMSTLEYMPEIDPSKNITNFSKFACEGKYSYSDTYECFAPKVSHYKFINDGSTTVRCSMNGFLTGNRRVEAITGLNLGRFNNYNTLALTNLKYLEVFNVNKALTIGSSNAGMFLNIDSLIHTIKELIDTGSSKTLTMGSTNTAKLANTYVKLIEDDGSGKLPFEVCSSTDEGAMLITQYVTLKNWAIA